jgi:hypothetical protein
MVYPNPFERALSYTCESSIAGFEWKSYASDVSSLGEWHDSGY